ncbi:MAG TPA: hypothetical protein VMW50_07030 [Dehalococcoidia bacterium]|nr:hypothetical protein [Dehalococcoidia bacterium]
MAQRGYSCSFLYQGDEEILETSWWYYEDVDGGEVGAAQRVCNELASIFLLRIGDFANFLGSNGFVMAAQVRSAALNGVGPCFATQNFALGGSNPEPCATDQITMRINWLGTGIDMQPHKNGMIISGIPNDVFDCNTLDETFLTAGVEPALDLLFPETLTTTEGTMIRGVRYQESNLDYVFVPCTEVVVAGVVGSDGTRRGNRSQKRGHLVPAVVVQE